MKRLLKLLVLLLAIAGAASAYSYAGARFATGKLIGPNPKPVDNRSITLPLKRVEHLPGRPYAWIFTFGRNQLGVPTVTVYVSLTGDVLSTVPRNLEARVAAWRAAREP